MVLFSLSLNKIFPEITLLCWLESCYHFAYNISISSGHLIMHAGLGSAITLPIVLIFPEVTWICWLGFCYHFAYNIMNITLILPEVTWVCWLGSCYHFVYNTTCTHEDCQAVCETMGAHLLAVENSREHDVLVDVMMKVSGEWRYKPIIKWVAVTESSVQVPLRLNI